MYRASIKQILVTILSRELLLKFTEIHTVDFFDKDLRLTSEEFNRFLYFVEMHFNITISEGEDISINDRLSDLVTCIYQKTLHESTFALKSA